VHSVPQRRAQGREERGVWLGNYHGHERIYIQEGSMVETTMSYEENVNENLFAVRALAFALLQCRSEKEALQVIKYFAKAKSRKSPSAEPVCGPDAPRQDSERN
jgi:hypothetical protein